MRRYASSSSSSSSSYLSSTFCLPGGWSRTVKHQTATIISSVGRVDRRSKQQLFPATTTKISLRTFPSSANVCVSRWFHATSAITIYWQFPPPNPNPSVGSCYKARSIPSRFQATIHIRRLMPQSTGTTIITRAPRDTTTSHKQGTSRGIRFNGSRNNRIQPVGIVTLKNLLCNVSYYNSLTRTPLQISATPQTSPLLFPSSERDWCRRR